MIDPPSIGLRIASAEDLPEPARDLLRPGEAVTDAAGRERRLPSYFYEVPSWEAALETRLAPHFCLWEFMDVDVREHRTIRQYPRYVPCAVAVLAGYLQLIRSDIGRVVRIAANGGYRSPAHRLGNVESRHRWGSAANIYRIGDEWLNSREVIEKYIDVARRTLPAAWVRPYGDRPGHAFDHLHVDLGYLSLQPSRDAEFTAAEEC